jgi:hypothetical protein
MFERPDRREPGFTQVTFGGLSGPVGLSFGHDGRFYVASSQTGDVLRYEGRTGAFSDVFVPAGSGRLTAPRMIAFKSKTKVCHRPGGNLAKARTLSIGYLSAFDHVAHGDSLGACR